jgi:hypothetical protein
MTVDQRINRKDKRWELDKISQFLGTKESATVLVHVSTVEGHHQTQDMQDIPDENLFPVESKSGSATALDRDVGVVCHFFFHEVNIPEVN